VGRVELVRWAFEHPTSAPWLVNVDLDFARGSAALTRERGNVAGKGVILPALTNNPAAGEFGDNPIVVAEGEGAVGVAVLTFDVLVTNAVTGAAINMATSASDSTPARLTLYLNLIPDTDGIGSNSVRRAVMQSRYAPRYATATAFPDAR